MVNETWLRRKGRIGQLKALGVLIIIVSGIALVAMGDSLATVMNNSAEPQPILLDRVVNGEIGPSRFVAVSGTAQYQSGYIRTNDNVEEDYYFLVDDRTNNMILVKSPTIIPSSRRSAAVTLYGVTHATSTKMQDFIEPDLADYARQGLKTITTLYLGEGETPPSSAAVLIPAAIITVLILLSIATFFFPSTLFAPMPIDSSVAAGDYSSNVQATGRFQKLSVVRPTFQFGKGTRKFVSAVANILALADRSWLIYIHFIYTVRAYGVSVRKTETDWGLPLNSTNVTDIQPGKVYGWRDRWAVRFQYKDDQQKPQTVIVSFKEAGDQVAFVKALGQSGFFVGSGEPALFGS